MVLDGHFGDPDTFRITLQINSLSNSNPVDSTGVSAGRNGEMPCSTLHSR